MLRSSSCFKFVCISLPIVISRPPTHLQLSISTTPPRYNTLDFLLPRFRFSRQLVLSLLYTNLHFHTRNASLSAILSDAMHITCFTSLDPCIQTPHLNSWFVCNFTDFVNMSITWFQDFHCGLHHIGRNDQDQANPIVKRPCHFNRFDISYLRQEFKDRSLWPRCRVDITTETLGQDTGYIVYETATCDMRHSFDVSCLDSRQHL